MCIYIHAPIFICMYHKFISVNTNDVALTARYKFQAKILLR